MTITVKVSEKTMETMNEFFSDMKRMKTPAYAVFQADDGDTVVTLYESGKAVFQGKDADLSSEFWIETEKINSGKAIVTNSEEKKAKDKLDKIEMIDPKIYYSNTIGSDEVGTGDFFGPMVVTASYVTKEDISFLEELGVKDSKKLTDDKIKKIAPIIAKRIKFHTVVFSDSEYNKRYDENTNMNKIKAILHNKCLGLLKSKIENYDYIIVDQFAEKFVYYNYLKNEPTVVKNITFMTKAEDKCLSVAVSSIISRYVFLNELNKMSKELGIILPKGANPKVDEVALQIKEKFGYNKLFEIAKMNFKNANNLK